MYSIFPGNKLTKSIMMGLATCATCFAISGFAAESDGPTVKANDFRAAARLELASAYYTQRQYGAALQEINQALSLHPKYLQAYNMLGLIEGELDHPKEAETAFQNALNLDEKDADTHNNYGLFLCKNKRITVAYKHFEAAALNPLNNNPAKSYYNAGRCARGVNDNVKAVHYFNEALRVDPRATVVMLELAEMQYQQKNYDVVLDVIERIEAIEGENPKTLWLALRSERRQGNNNEVESYGTQLVKNFPDSPEAILFRTKSFD